MTKEDKDLLLKVLCAGLPYGVYVHIRYKTGEPCYGKLTPRDIQWFIDSKIENIKPYLRPMSSMTEEEKENLQLLHDIISDENYGDGYSPSACDAIVKWEDYCNSKHLDYRGLISMGLALKAPEGMYENNN